MADEAAVGVEEAHRDALARARPRTSPWPPRARSAAGPTRPCPSMRSAEHGREAGPPPRRRAGRALAATPTSSAGREGSGRRARRAPTAPTRSGPARSPRCRAAAGNVAPGQLLVEHAGVALHRRHGARPPGSGAGDLGGAHDVLAAVDPGSGRPWCPAPSPGRRRPGALPSDGGRRITGWGFGTGGSYHDRDDRLHHARRPPEGEEKVEAVRSMFDAIAPRYDLVNRIMTFRMDVRWRRRTVRHARPAAGRDGDRPRLRHRRPVPRARRAAPRPHRRRPVVRHAGRRPHRPLRSCTATRSACRSPTASVGRRHLRVRPAELRGAAALLRRARPDRPPRRAHRAARGGRAAQPGAPRRATASTSARSCRSSAGCCPTRPPTGTCRARSPTCPSPSVMLDQLARRRLRRRRRALLSVGIAQLVTATRRPSPPHVIVHAARRPHPPGRPRPRPAGAGRRRRRAARAVAGRPGRPRGRGRASRRVAEVDAVARRHRGRRPGRRARHRRRSRFGALPFAPDADAPMVVPEVVWGRAEDGTRWVTTIGPADAPEPDLATRSARPAPAGRRRLPGAVHRRARPPGRVVVRAGRPSHQGACATAGPDGLHKVVLAREVLVEADVPFDRAVLLRSAPGRATPAASSSTSTGSSGPAPSCSSAAPATSCGPSRWPAPCAAAATPPPTPAGRRAARLGHLPPRAPDHHRHGVRHAHPLVLVPRLRAGAVGGRRRQPPAPGHHGRGPALAAGPVGASSSCARSHPTPAVNGWPRATAQAWIAEHEGFDRGRYAGTVGWVDGRGQRHLRRQHPLRRRRTAPRPASCAGNGIVADSDPDTELAETQVKLQALLSALTRV